MNIKITKNSNFQEIDKLLSSMMPNPRKAFCSKNFLGKVKWGEDALEYQKRIRDEWD